jgi:VCBS repeat-containing protein
MAGIAKGITVSFANTPQAQDDAFSPSGLTADTLGTYVLDVLATDLGGGAKSLWSLDDGISAGGASPADLLHQDTARTEVLSLDRSALGAVIWITNDGKVGYDANPLQGTLQQLAAGEYATDSFTYAIRLGNGTLSWATATIKIVGINDAPVITNIAAALGGGVKEDVTLSVSGQLSAADPDHGDHQHWSVPGSTTGTYGSITVDPSGKWTYILNNDTANVQALAANEQHDETFTIRVADDYGAYVDQTVKVTVKGTNDAACITTSAAEDTSVIEAGGIANAATDDPSASGILSVHDVDTGENHFAAVPAASLTGAYGNFTFDSASGAWTYALDQAKADALTAGQQVTDALAVSSLDGSASQAITVNITGSNDAPVAIADTLSTVEDTPITYTAAQLLANDTDADTLNSALSIASVASGTGGTAVLNANSSVTFTPDGNFNGVANFTYAVTDGAAVSATTASVTVNVTANNDAPVNTVPGAQITNQNTSKSITGLSVSDVDAGAGVITTSLEVSHGTISSVATGGATVSGNGTGTVTISGTLSQVNATLAAAITYSPASGYFGDDTFKMTTSDNGNSGAGGPLTDTDTVLITVNPVNHAPVAGNDLIVVSSQTTGVAIPVAALLANDTDIDGNSLSIVGVGAPSSNLSNLSLSSGNIFFDTGNTTADQSFTYTLSDGTTTSSATVTVKMLDTSNGTGSPDTVNLAAVQYSGYVASYIDLRGGNDSATGGGVALDTFLGGNGNDILLSGGGKDILVGGAGNDVLTGGAGSDTFVFNTALDASNNVDTVNDFNASTIDQIQLSAAIFSKLSPGLLAAANFAGNAGGIAGDSNDYILYDTTSGNLYYDADGNGGVAKVLFAKLVGVAGTVDSTDFLVTN